MCLHLQAVTVMVVLVAVVATTQADHHAPPPPPGGPYSPPDPYKKKEPGMPYEVHYEVKDYFGNDFGHWEKSDGHKVEGNYHVVLPDGRTQTVTFTADHDHGYVAHVEYEGEAKYPEPEHKGYNQYEPPTTTPGYHHYEPPAPTYHAPAAGGHGHAPASGGHGHAPPAGGHH